MMTFIEKVTDLKYELPMAYLDKDIQLLSYASSFTGLKVKDQRL
jgi:hypothetical protein